MNIMEAMRARHSVRSYTDQKIEGETLANLRQIIEDCNQKSGLHIQLCLNEPTAFTGMMARYGKFNNVKNYIALVGPKSDTLEETCGYYGEKIVLAAQQMGLNTCWVAMTFSKGKSKTVINIAPGEKLLLVIAIGYGTTEGTAHTVKPISVLAKAEGEMPAWFLHGMEAAQLAPTATNQQKFLVTLNGNTVHTSAGSGFYSKTDLGIVKYHFEVGAADDSWNWADGETVFLA